MKKIFLLAALCFFALCPSVFANDFELGATLLLTPSGEIAGRGLNIASTDFFTKYIGYGVFGTILFSNPGDARISGPAAESDETEYGHANLRAGILLGPLFNFITTKVFTLPLCLGVYGSFTFATGKDEPPEEGANIGPGGNITAKFHINDVLGVYARLEAAYGIFSNPDYRLSLKPQKILLRPSVGVSVKFQ